MSKETTTRNILLSWIGQSDLNASEGNDELGPVAQAITNRTFDHVVLLCNYPKKACEAYLNWLQKKTSVPVAHHLVKLSSPTNFGEIYQCVIEHIEGVFKQHGADAHLTYHLSPGTPAMSAVWIIIAKSRYAAELIETSREGGLKTASIPFDISAEFIPGLLRRPDHDLTQLATAVVEDAPEFDAIIHRSDVMKRVIARARKVAPRSVPVLIEGESGTGKELMARAIHMASPANNEAFIAVNCGAIASELFESEFFGHVKGAFTGAHNNRKGHFESAHAGTLFLDEVGELSLENQVKLLRVIQEKKVTPVGSSKPVEINTRIIAATNRVLSREVEAGRFREDLFYRLAVAVINLPPLHARQGDLGLLIEHVMEKINAESAAETDWEYKNLSVSAKKLMLNHAWRGNVRELVNTLTRAAVWSDGATISKEAIEEALLDMPNRRLGDDEILNHDISQGVDLQSLMQKVARHYLGRAMKEVNGNKSSAAKKLGLKSYQTLNNWIKRYELE